VRPCKLKPVLELGSAWTERLKPECDELLSGFKFVIKVRLYRLEGIMELLSRRTTTSSAWLHLMCINLFVGRHAAVKVWPAGHCLPRRPTHFEPTILE